jgi:arylsulfatase A-like enzyme
MTATCLKEDLVVQAFNSLIKLIAVLLLLFNAAAHAAPLPNIVLIMADDLGYGDLSSYGAADMQTPYIDSIAKRGVRLTNYYANSTVCSPTRAALMTGKFSDLAGVPGVVRPDTNDSYGYLDPALELMPSHLKKKGYKTALIGKWHLGLSAPNLPNERGFDLYRGHLSGMMDYYTHEHHGLSTLRHNETPISVEGHATDLFSDWAVEYLHEQQGSDRPFFLYLAYTAPHSPIQPPEENVTRVMERKSGLDEKRAKFVALVEHMDDGVGRVLTALEENGKLQNTLVIFISDNGGAEWLSADNGPLRGGKQDLFEGGIKVPGMAMWPGKIKHGTTRDDVMLSMDWLPTFASLFGMEVAHAMDGRNMSAILLGGEAPANDRTLVWVRREGRDMMGIPHYAVRQGDYKLVVNHPFEPPLMFNLADDPYEQNPIEMKGNSLARQLEELLQAHIIASGRVPWRDPRGADLGLPD